jgi:hypothetical protein
MPKSRSLLLTSFYLSILTSTFLLFPFPAHAATDPQLATTSATAKIPSTSPSAGDNTPPTLPILISPVDGTVTGDNRPEFVWTRSTDPNGNTVLYTLYLNGVASYLGISNIGNSIGTGYTSRLDGNQIKLLPTSSLTDGAYNWYVTASDPSNNTSQSTVWNLTIDTTAPYISITDIDTYRNLTLDSSHPELFAGLSFDIPGPKDVYFTIHSESWSTVTLQFFSPDNVLLYQSNWPVDGTGVIYPYQHLALGTYKLSVTAFDHGGNTTALPEFTMVISQSQISIPIPDVPGLPGLPPALNIPYTIPSLPATVSQITSRLPLSLALLPLLALASMALLLFVWRRRYNIILTDKQGNPLSNTIIYHSIPTDKSIYTKVYVTRKDPISYELVPLDLGKLYIRHLSRYSTLTVRTSTATHILSISRKAKLYTIIL